MSTGVTYTLGIKVIVSFALVHVRLTEKKNEKNKYNYCVLMCVSFFFVVRQNGIKRTCGFGEANNYY